MLPMGLAPLPDRLAVCRGLPKALSLTVSVAVCVPVFCGVKVTLMVQLALTARVAGLTGQLLVRVKSPLLVPVMVMLLIVIASLPVFESVTACGVLGVPTCWLGKFTVVADTLATGARPAPARLTSACPLPKLLSPTGGVAVRLDGVV